MRKSGAEDLLVNTFDLDIHLDSGDAFPRTSDLEVHIAEEVFQALNIAHDGDFAAFNVLDKTHSDTGNGRLDGHAGIHKSKGAAADTSLRGGTVGAQDLGNGANGIREILLAGKNGFKRSFSKGAVSDLTPAGAL